MISDLTIFRIKPAGHTRYTYVQIGSVNLAFFGADLVAFTSPDGGVTLLHSQAFPDRKLETASTYKELAARAILAIATNAAGIVDALVDEKLTG